MKRNIHTGLLGLGFRDSLRGLSAIRERLLIPLIAPGAAIIATNFSIALSRRFAHDPGKSVDERDGLVKRLRFRVKGMA